MQSEPIPDSRDQLQCVFPTHIMQNSLVLIFQSLWRNANVHFYKSSCHLVRKRHTHSAEWDILISSFWLHHRTLLFFIKFTTARTSGVIVGDSGLCCCGPAYNVWRQFFKRNYFPLFVDFARLNQLGHGLPQWLAGRLLIATEVCLCTLWPGQSKERPVSSFWDHHEWWRYILGEQFSNKKKICLRTDVD